MKIHVDELKEHLGKEITFSGFVDEIRNLMGYVRCT